MNMKRFFGVFFVVFFAVILLSFILSINRTDSGVVLTYNKEGPIKLLNNYFNSDKNAPIDELSTSGGVQQSPGVTGTPLSENQVYIKNSGSFQKVGDLVSIPISFQPCEYFEGQNDVRLREVGTTEILDAQIQITGYYQRNDYGCAVGSAKFAVLHFLAGTSVRPFMPGEERIYDIVKSTQQMQAFTYAPEIQNFLTNGVIKTVSKDVLGNDYVANIPLNQMTSIVDGPILKIYKYDKMNEIQGSCTTAPCLPYLFSTSSYITFVKDKPLIGVESFVVNSPNFQELTSASVACQSLDAQGHCTYRKLSDNSVLKGIGAVKYGSLRLEVNGGQAHNFYFPDISIRAPSKITQNSANSVTLWIMPSDGQSIMSAYGGSNGGNFPNNYLGEAQGLMVQGVVYFGSYLNNVNYNSYDYFIENDWDNGQSFLRWSKVKESVTMDTLPDPEKLGQSSNWYSESDALDQKNVNRGLNKTYRSNHPISNERLSEASASFPYDIRLETESPNKIKYLLSCQNRCIDNYLYAMRYKILQEGIFVDHLVGYNPWEHPKSNPTLYTDYSTENFYLSRGQEKLCDSTTPTAGRGYPDSLTLCSPSAPSPHAYDYSGSPTIYSSYADTHWGTGEGDYIFFKGDQVYKQIFLGPANLIADAAYNADDLALRTTVYGAPRNLGRKAYGLTRVAQMFNPTSGNYYKTALERWIIRWNDRLDHTPPGGNGVNPITGRNLSVGYLDNDDLGAIVPGHTGDQAWMESIAAEGLVHAKVEILENPNAINVANTVLNSLTYYLFNFAYRDPTQVRNGVTVTVNGQNYALNEGFGYLTDKAIISGALPGNSVTKYDTFSLDDSTYHFTSNALCLLSRYFDSNPTYKLWAKKAFEVKYFTYIGTYNNVISRPGDLRYMQGIDYRNINGYFLCGMTYLEGLPTASQSSVTCTDNDGDGFSTCSTVEWDCNDNDPNIKPTAFEDQEHSNSLACSDGIDNNCNGLIDCEDPMCNNPDYNHVGPNVCLQSTYCGDTVIQNPNAVGVRETCDINTGSLSFSNSCSLGQCVPSSVPSSHGNRCTCAIAAICGDGQVNQLSEECDGSALGICGPSTSCSASCLCNGPVLNSISPNSIVNPVSNVVVTVTGRGFTATPSVRLNNVAHPEITVSYINSSMLSLTFTPTAVQNIGSGSYQLSIVNPNSQQTRSLLLTLTAGSNNLCTNALMVGPGKTYAKPSDAIAAATNGSTILIFPGTYQDYATITQDNIVIRGVSDSLGNRPKITNSSQWTSGYVPNGKAIFVLRSPHIVIDNLEISGAVTSSANGAALRVESPVSSLTVRNSYFHDSQMQILQDEGNPNFNALIENNEFSHATSCPNNDLNLCSHLVYFNSAVGASITVRYNYFHEVKRMHLFKSRAAVNYILYNRFTDEVNGQSNYHIDLSQGGDNYVIGNVFQQNNNARNSHIIVVNTEINDPLKPANPIQNLYVVANTIVDNLQAGGIMVAAYNTGIRSLDNYLIRDNIFLTATSAQSAFEGSPTLDTNLIGPVSGFTWFRNAANYDYALTSGAIAINTGNTYGTSATGYSLTPNAHYVHNAKHENRTIVGSIPDIGAYEFNGGSGSTCFATTEICDGLDNDCNGQIDEGGVCNACTGGISRPFISSIQPLNFSVSNNTLVIVTGQNFTSTSDIRIDGFTVNTIRISSNELRWNYTSNSLSSGAHVVNVYNPNSGLTSNSVNINLLTPPNPPRFTSAIPQSSTVIFLTWIDASNNEEYFEMERRQLPSGSFASMPFASHLNPNTITFNNSGLSPGTGYEYRLRAVNSAGPSLWSNFINATTASNMVLNSLSPSSMYNNASRTVQLIGTGFPTSNCWVEINGVLVSSSIYSVNCVNSQRIDLTVPMGTLPGTYSLSGVTLNSLNNIIARTNSLNLIISQDNLSDSDSDGVPDSIDRCPNTPTFVATTYGINRLNGCPLPSIFPLSASLTTNFSNVPDLFAVNDLRAGIVDQSSILFKVPINMLWLNSTGNPSYHLPFGFGPFYLNLSKNYVFLNSTRRPDLNVRAEITFYNTSLTNPVLYRDGALCQSENCSIISFDTSSGNVVANVSGFSSYSLLQGSCGDNLCSIAETCSSCAADCGPCSGGGSGGGGSGGGSSGGGGGGGSGGGSRSSPSINRASAQCSDGVDNDGDGLIDFPNDPGCFDSLDNVELDSGGLGDTSKIVLGDDPNSSSEKDSMTIRVFFWTIFAVLLIAISLVILLIIRHVRVNRRLGNLASGLSSGSY